MPTQQALAEAAKLGLRTVVAVENGEKVSARTMRKIEVAIGLPVGAADDYLAGKVTEFPKVRTLRAVSAPAGPDLRDEVERKLWAITDLSEDERWAYIYQHRARQEQRYGE